MLQIGAEGLLIATFTLIAFYIGLQSNNKLVPATMAFSTLCLARLFHGFNCRGKQSIFKLGLFSNKYSIYAFVTGLVLFIPPLQKLFEIAPLNKTLVAYIYILAFMPTLFIQIYKVFTKDFDIKISKKALKKLYKIN